MNHDIILKRFEEPDELREFEKGRFEVIHFASGDNSGAMASFVKDYSSAEWTLRASFTPCTFWATGRSRQPSRSKP